MTIDVDVVYVYSKSADMPTYSNQTNSYDIVCCA